MIRTILQFLLWAFEFILFLSPGLTAAALETNQAVAASVIDYARDIQPILHGKCGDCHGKIAPQANLSVMTRADMLGGIFQAAPVAVSGTGW